MPKRRAGLKVITRKGTTSLYIRGTVQHRRIFESAGTDDPKLAEERRAVREAEIYRAAVHRTPERVTFAAAALSYLQTGEHGPGTRHRVGRLVRHLGAVIGCDQVTQAALDASGRFLCREGSAPATRHREVVTPAKAILQHAARRGWCAPPVFETAKGGGKRTDWMTPEEAEALIRIARPHAAALFTFLFCTGARMGEALALRWRTVDLRHARATLEDTKNGYDRIIDLPPRAVAMLANLPHRAGRVFLNARGKAYRQTNDDDRTPYGGQAARAFSTALRNAGNDRHLTPHHARHSWASWHYCVHKDLMRLRDDGGWRTVAMCERYAKLVPAGMRASILKFLGAPDVQTSEEYRNVG